MKSFWVWKKACNFVQQCKDCVIFSICCSRGPSQTEKKMLLEYYSLFMLEAAMNSFKSKQNDCDKTTIHVIVITTTLFQY